MPAGYMKGRVPTCTIVAWLVATCAAAVVTATPGPPLDCGVGGDFCLLDIDGGPCQACMDANNLNVGNGICDDELVWRSHCSVTTTNACEKDKDCPGGETCVHHCDSGTCPLGATCSAAILADCAGANDCNCNVLTGTPTDTPTSTETQTPATTPTVTLTITPTVTGTATATSTPTPLCAATPVSGCRQPGRASILLKAKLTGSRNLMMWKWGRGAATDRIEFGDPLTGSTSYAICVYDESGGEPSLVISATAPAVRLYAGRPCWKETTQGFRYFDANASPDGLLRVRLNAGVEGRAAITVKATGNHFPMPAPMSTSQLFHQNNTVTVQLVNSDGGVCWESGFHAPASRNTADQFKERLP